MRCHGEFQNAVDLAAVAESEKELIKKLNRWKDGVA